MKAVKMNVFVGSDRRLVVDLPEQVQEGPAELILLMSSDQESHEADHLKNRLWIENILKQVPKGKSRKELDREIHEQRNSWE